MTRTRLREDEHRARAQRHRVIGDVLASAGDEWAAVPLFYAAYHIIKGALLRDPVWGDLPALRAIHGDLIPDDRFTDFHRGRIRAGQAREFGVNELVGLLYPVAMPHYERLHQASISVRYSVGLPGGALPALIVAIEAIEELESNGDLEAALLWPKDQP